MATVRATEPPVPPVVDSGGGAADAAWPDVVFTLSGHVDAGGEVFNCLYVTMPSDGETAVPRAESHYTPGSHHFLTYRTNYAAIPNGGDTVHICSDAEQFQGITGSYYEAQTPDAERDLPPGVAHIFQPGEVMLLTAHYLNATGTGFDTHVEFRLHTMDPANVTYEAGSVYFYNPQISIPPLSEITVRRTCPISQDINLALLWSHMHSRGIGFTATTDDSAATDQVGDLYSTMTWSEPQPRVFPYDPAVTLHGGSKITYECTYRNTTQQTIISGQSARTNEMCILHGMYWPRQDSKTEMCVLGTSTTDAPISLDKDDIDASAD
jgi:hypothetical protein